MDLKFALQLRSNFRRAPALWFSLSLRQHLGGDFASLRARTLAATFPLFAPAHWQRLSLLLRPQRSFSRCVHTLVAIYFPSLCARTLAATFLLFACAPWRLLSLSLRQHLGPFSFALRRHLCVYFRIFLPFAFRLRDRFEDITVLRQILDSSESLRLYGAWRSRFV